MVSETSIGRLVDSYEAAVTVGLDDEDTSDTEALLALSTRDAIQQRRSDLDPSLAARVGRIDGMLAEKRDRLLEVLPHPSITDRTRWWWFLHERPHDREAFAASHRTVPG